METSDNASDHNTAARSNKNDDDSDKKLYIVDDADDHTALSNKNHDDSCKQLYIVDDADDHTVLSNNNYDDSDKQLYIADDTYFPDDNKAPGILLYLIVYYCAPLVWFQKCFFFLNAATN